MMSDLTEREVDVGRELLRGQRLSKIASRMGLAHETVKNHITNMSWKLGRAEEDKELSVRVFVAVKLSEAARKYPLVAAALEV